MIDYMIEKLTELLIKQKYKDKEKGTAYIKKIDAYNDIINLLKQIKKEGTYNEFLEKEN